MLFSNNLASFYKYENNKKVIAPSIILKLEQYQVPQAYICL